MSARDLQEVHGSSKGTSKGDLQGFYRCFTLDLQGVCSVMRRKCRSATSLLQPIDRCLTSQSNPTTKALGLFCNEDLGLLRIYWRSTSCWQLPYKHRYWAYRLVTSHSMCVYKVLARMHGWYWCFTAWLQVIYNDCEGHLEPLQGVNWLFYSAFAAPTSNLQVKFFARSNSRYKCSTMTLQKHNSNLQDHISTMFPPEQSVAGL